MALTSKITKNTKKPVKKVIWKKKVSKPVKKAPVKKVAAPAIKRAVPPKPVK
jgi:hypothetical protein